MEIYILCQKGWVNVKNRSECYIYRSFKDCINFDHGFEMFKATLRKYAYIDHDNYKWAYMTLAIVIQQSEYRKRVKAQSYFTGLKTSSSI